MGEDFRILKVETYVDIAEDGRFVKVYKIEVEILGKYRDWIEVTADEFISGKYLEKIKELVERYKELEQYTKK